ncbi:hypothetical protein E0Z10_g9885 [Xylaria hypoxylon]|uniref:OPT family small oligopeptide transporter n=1 Tax=Xylaria hypoxylon TaxID=37992 RepID=A0A4Z0YQM1_9PEZI|nr:hypothetical protein E0Z10_g9885 [Xylaria hypoxylon]
MPRASTTPARAEHHDDPSSSVPPLDPRNIQAFPLEAIHPTIHPTVQPGVQPGRSIPLASSSSPSKTPSKTLSNPPSSSTTSGVVPAKTPTPKSHPSCHSPTEHCSPTTSVPVPTPFQISNISRPSSPATAISAASAVADVDDITPPLLRVSSDASHTSLSPDEASPLPGVRHSRGTMSKSPLLLRSSPGFGTGSYGAAPIPPELDDDSDQHPRPASLLSRETTGTTRERQHHTASTSRASAFRTSTSSLSRRRRSQSDEINRASTVVGGLEGRFGVSDAAVLNDILSDNKSGNSTSDEGAALGEEDDAASEGQDEDPPDNSPYPQVRASVAPTDNTTLSINTPRMWILSCLFSVLGSSTNLFFSLRYPSVAITPVIALLLVHPLGLMWDYLLKRPDDPPEEFVEGVRTSAAAPRAGPSSGLGGEKGTRAHRLRLWLAQGSWNEKEHSCVYVSSNVSFGFAFATDIIVEQTQFYKQDEILVANLFGVVSGLGLFPITFDWAQVAYIGSPLLTPFWASMNVIGGLVIVMWIIAPIAYYCNLFYSSYMPILSASVFDNTGQIYDVGRILTPDFLFDRAAYSKYSRVYLPITYVLSYGLQFAGLASLLTHTACWHGKDIWTQWKRSLKKNGEESEPLYQPLQNEGNGIASFRRTDSGMASSANIEDLLSREDVHNRLMRRYKDAPIYWYLLTFISMTAIGIFVVEYYPVHLPWYGLLLALGICSILFIPIGIVMAVTNQHSSIYLICQLICGAVFPGRPVANMVFVTYGYISSAQGIKFAADLKLGHYMKIPPRILFLVQMVATIVSSITQITVLNWMFRNVPGICTPSAINGFTCPIARVHFNGSILWGVVGPAEFFGPSAVYRSLVWCFLIGAIAPIPLWLYGRRKRNSIVRKINLPVLFGSLSWIPPATGLNFSVWAVVCYIFNYLIKNRANAWWAKYTMTLSAALDSGLAFGIVIVFFGFIYPGWMDNFSWWGTEVYRQGCDWQACAYRTVPNGSHFGPGSGW